ncbi:CTP synthase [bioreactor metagenome]|uniref:CTP synthase (glutamine hydrolyzing) n=1 Tax=bioreactor metagenome TaxID=1076179 RepID=A0A645BGP8_9ZZZZ
MEVGKENCMFVHVTLIPYAPGSDEYKSKPTQHSVKELLSIGIQPDILVCRCDQPTPQDMKNKIAMFCNVKANCVIDNINASTLYEIPLMLGNQGIDKIVCDRLEINTKDIDLKDWSIMVDKIKNCKKEITIALVGKYIKLHDAYLSVAEALFHGGIYNDVKVNIQWTDSEEVCEENVKELFENCDGILVPGGFGNRGIEGKIIAIKYARENKIPFLGICLGMQMAVIEFARNVLGLYDANSREFDESTNNPVIDIMPDQKNITDKGGTMRLGAYPCNIQGNSLLHDSYHKTTINERHRHRFEFNNDYRENFSENGFILSGISPDGRLVEAVELKDHPWFIGVQYHPEFKSRPNNAHPLFAHFIEAAKKHK